MEGLEAGDYKFTVVLENLAGTSTTNFLNTATVLPLQAPIFTGTVTATNITNTTYTLHWPAATDDNAVSGYEVSVNNGATWQDVGNVLQLAVTGRSVAFPDQVKVRAYDEDHVLSAPLSATVTLVDTQPPIWPDEPELTASSVGATLYTMSWNAATDLGGIAGYRWRVNGEAWNQITQPTVNVTGRTPATTDTFEVQALDNSGNASTSLTLQVNLLPIKKVRLALTTNGVLPAANLTGLSGSFFNESRRHLLTQPAVKFSGASTDSNGILEIDVTFSSVPIGGWGYLIEGTSDATPDGDGSGWHGPVQVVG
jgi:hypothetical protein